LRSELAIALLAASCGGSASFVAMQEDFADFQSWERFDLGDGVPNLGHTTGPRAVWLSERPGRHDDAFPIGTMIVKAAGDPADPSTWAIVARAKRAEDYNPGGAAGWEWFGLELTDAGLPAIAWRGPEAPDCVAYAFAGEEEVDTADAPVRGNCNICHRAARDNDTVLTPALDLDALR
jgi:hypothetical protein